MKNSAKITPKIPDGMVELLKNLAKGVLKEQPENIYLFAAEYFDNLVRERDGSLNKGYATFRKYDDETVDRRNFDVCPRCNCILHPERKDEDSAEEGPSPRNDDENALDMSVNGVAIKAVARDGKSKNQKNRQRLETIRSVSTDSAIEDDGKSKSTSPKSAENSSMQNIAVPAVGAVGAVGALAVVSSLANENKEKEMPTENMEIDTVPESPVNEINVDPVSNAKISSDEEVPDTPTNDTTSMSEAYTDRTVIEVAPINVDAKNEEVNVDSNPADESPPDENEIVNELGDKNDLKTEVIPTVVTESVDDGKATDANNDESKPSDDTNLQLVNNKQMDRLRTPESDSGLSEKSFNLNIQENEDAVTNEVNEIESEHIFTKTDHLNTNEKDGDTTSKDDSGIVDVDENKHFELDNESETPIVAEVRDENQFEEKKQEEINDDSCKKENSPENEALNAGKPLENYKTSDELQDTKEEKEIAPENLIVQNELPKDDVNKSVHDESAKNETTAAQESTTAPNNDESPSETAQSTTDIIAQSISKPSSPIVDTNNEPEQLEGDAPAGQVESEVKAGQEAPVGEDAPVDGQVESEVMNDAQNDANSKVESAKVKVSEIRNEKDDETVENGTSAENKPDEIIFNEDNNQTENNSVNDLSSENKEAIISDEKQPDEKESEKQYSENTNDATDQSPNNETQNDQVDNFDANLKNSTEEKEKPNDQAKEVNQSEVAAEGSTDEMKADQNDANENVNETNELLDNKSGVQSKENPSNEEDNNIQLSDSTNNIEKVDEVSKSVSATRENSAEQKNENENKTPTELIGLNEADSELEQEKKNTNDLDKQNEEKGDENSDETAAKEEHIKNEEDLGNQIQLDSEAVPNSDTPLTRSAESKNNDDKAIEETPATDQVDTTQKIESANDATSKEEVPQEEEILISEPEIVKTESKSIESKAEDSPTKSSVETFKNNENNESNEPDSENNGKEHATWEEAVEKIAKNVDESDANQKEVIIPDLIDDENSNVADNISMKSETKPDENVSENGVVSKELENPNNETVTEATEEQTGEKDETSDEKNDKNETEQTESKTKSATSNDQPIERENSSKEKLNVDKEIDENLNQEKAKNDSNNMSNELTENESQSMEKAENGLDKPASAESIKNENTTNGNDNDKLNENKPENHVEVEQTDTKSDFIPPDEAADEVFSTPPELNNNEQINDNNNNEQTNEISSAPKTDDTSTVKLSDEPKNIPEAESMYLKDEPSNERNGAKVIENGELISPQQEGSDSIDEVKENQTTASHSVGVNESVEKSAMPTEGVDEPDSQSEENRTVESVNNGGNANGSNDTNANEKAPSVNDESGKTNATNGNIEHERSNDYETKSNNDDGASELSVSTKDDLYEQADTEIVEDESVKDLDLSSNNNIEPTQTNESVESEQQITALEVPAQIDNDSIESPKQNPMQPDSLDALVDSLDGSEASSLIVDSLEDKSAKNPDSAKSYEPSHEPSNEVPNEVSKVTSNDALNDASNEISSPIGAEDQASHDAEKVETKPQSSGSDRE